MNTAKGATHGSAGQRAANAAPTDDSDRTLRDGRAVTAAAARRGDQPP
ncbi:MAG: hypothetical protein ACK56I_36560 [bacterium]